MNKSKPHHISNQQLTIHHIAALLLNQNKLALSEESKEQILHCRAFLENKIKQAKDPIYGINTGFGSLCNVEIQPEGLKDLQANLVRSHACGTGDKVPTEVVQIMLLLKAQSLSYGFSGIRLETVEQIIQLYNHGLLPVIYQQGSLGASGDLAPLAHMALSLMGEGESYYQGKIVDSGSVLKKIGLPAVILEAKEGLALLNGTQFMGAYGVSGLINSWKLLNASIAIAALSAEAFQARVEPFFHHSHQIRKHNGQAIIAETILNKLSNSQHLSNAVKAVQDPYSFRCIPQVLGAVYDSLTYCTQVIEDEINSVTDNPNIFPDDDIILSAGNFHGEPIAMALDFLAIALNEIASISERRTYLLISGQRGLPAYLVNKPGIQSGLMIPQYTAASIVSQNKQLATPCSIDSIPSSNGQEDHVSMGANGATRIYKMANNVKTVLAIELLTAAQAIDFRAKDQLSKANQALFDAFRAEVPFIDKDRALYKDIAKAEQFIEQYFVDLDLSS